MSKKKPIVCKVQCVGIERIPGMPNDFAGRRVTFDAVYDSLLPHDRTFSKATPTARLTAQFDNPDALGDIAVGRSYRLAIGPWEPPAQ